MSHSSGHAGHAGHDSAASAARLDALQSAARRAVAADTGALVILRHSIRGPIPKHPDRRDVPITDAGRTLATRLGTRWQTPAEMIVSSPMLRCRDTARCFVLGSPCLEPGTIPTTTRLGDPGPFVLDSARAWDNYFRLGKHALVRWMLERPDERVGYRPLGAGVGLLLDELAGDAPELVLGFSHDLIMALIVGWIRGRGLDDDEWPQFCDGLLLRRVGGSAQVWYRGVQAERALP